MYCYIKNYAIFKHTYFFVIAVVICFFIVLCGTFPNFSSRREKITFHLILTGFSKGRFLPYQNNFPPYPNEVMGGIDRTVVLVDKIVTEFNNEPWAFFSLGGELSGSPEAYLTQGEFVIDALNFLPLTGMLIGNLEFTFGKKRLAELRSKSKFHFLSSNIVEIGSRNPPDFITPELVIKYKGGLNVAFLGITPPSTANMTVPSNVYGYHFNSPSVDIRNKVSKLRQDGADLVFILSQYNDNSLNSKDWEAIKLAKPDFLIMADFLYQSAEPFLREGIWVKRVNGYNQGKELDILSVTIGEIPRKILEVKGRRIPIFSEKVVPNKEVTVAIDKVLSLVQAEKNIKIAEFAENLERQYNKECPIGNIVADAMKTVFPGDVALQNSGGIQNNIRAGEFLQGDLYSVLPFDNAVVAMDLPGTALMEIFSQAASLRRGVIQISGGSYKFSHRSENDFELIEVCIGSSPLLATATYRVITNSFLAEGGDEFTAFRKGKNVVVGPLQREVVKDFLIQKGKDGPIRSQVEGRIIVYK